MNVDVDEERPRIINAGVTAYGTDQEYLLLRRLWDEFKPSVVVLMFCFDNDRQDNTTNSTAGHYKPYLRQTPDGQWVFAGQPMPKSRRAYFVGQSGRQKSLAGPRRNDGYVYFRYPKITVPDPTEQLVGMMHDFITARGARFMIGLQHHEARLETFLSARGTVHLIRRRRVSCVGRRLVLSEFRCVTGEFRWKTIGERSGIWPFAWAADLIGNSCLAQVKDAKSLTIQSRAR